MEKKHYRLLPEDIGPGMLLEKNRNRLPKAKVNQHRKCPGNFQVRSNLFWDVIVVGTMFIGFFMS